MGVTPLKTPSFFYDYLLFLIHMAYILPIVPLQTFFRLRLKEYDMAFTTDADNSSAHSPNLPNPPTTMNPPFGIHTAMPQLLGWAVNSYAPLMLVLGAVAAARSYAYQLLALVENHFTTEFHVKNSDPSHGMLMAWVYSKDLNKSARSRIVRANCKGPNMQSHSDAEARPIWYAPWNGSFFFWYGGTILSYRSYTTTKAFGDEEHIILKCIGRSGKVLHDFIEDCQRLYNLQNKNMTTILEHRGDFWHRKATQSQRTLSNVIISDQLKQDLVGDLKEFNDPKNRAKYSERSIPYRRGYLLHGPPGTGKSSLALAIAGQCNLDIYIVNIPCVNDEQLKELFDNLPGRCLVLLEDIDAVAVDRDEDGDNHRKQRHLLSLSGLLNTLDGVAAHEGHLLVMTTNHKELLDPALIRRGRIDRDFNLNYADRNLTANTFKFMFMPVGDAVPLEKAELVATERAAEIEEIERAAEIVAIKRAAEIAAIEQAAEDFAEIIPDHEFSVADIISYLKQNWSSPAAALDNSSEWVSQALKEKRCKEESSDVTVIPVSFTARAAAENGDLEWQWASKDAKVQNDIPRTKNHHNLSATACITPPPSPRKSSHCHEASEENSPFFGSDVSLLPVQGVGSFGCPLSFTLPGSWFGDGMDDCRTETSEASSEGLFIVPPKRLNAYLPRTASYETCPGLDSASQMSFVPMELLDSPASAISVVSSGSHVEKLGREVQEWRYWTDSRIGSLGDLLPNEDNTDRVAVEEF